MNESANDLHPRSNRRPARCPQCGHQPVAQIAYGLMAISPKRQAELDAGRTVLGGCCITEDDAAWQCTRCGWQGWPKLKEGG